MREFLAVIVVVVIFLCGGVAGFYSHKSEVSRDLDELAQYRKTHLRKQGWSRGFGTYDLRSFDGGKNWYAVVAASDGAVIVNALAEEMFPGLLAHVYGLDTLIGYIEKYGSITLCGPRATTDRKILEAAGFSVEATSGTDGGTDQQKGATDESY